MTTAIAYTEAKMYRLPLPELERRWALVRDYLQSNGLEALIVQGYEDKIGGYVKWLTDTPAGYPRTVIFHADDLMTVIEHGPNGQKRLLVGADEDHPGVGDVHTNWAFQTAYYSNHLNAAQVAEVVRDRGYARVAIANPSGLPHGFVSGLFTELKDCATIVDATEFLDRAKAQKSPTEIELIKRAAAMQDEVFGLLLEWITPGVRDFEISAFLSAQLEARGTERGIYIGKSAPFGKAAGFGYRHFQGRSMNRGDYICVLLESNSLGGYWTEMARTICFGKPPASLINAFERAKEAQEFTASLCIPGASPAEIFTEFNEYKLARGEAPERRIHAHSQGYDSVERPLIRTDEPMPLELGCSLAIHPSHSTPHAYGHICDNYLIEHDGSAGFIHKTPKILFEL